MLFGASESELREYSLKLSEIESFNYINLNAKPSSNQHADDKQNYRVVNEAMRIANFDAQLIKTIWSIVAAIVHLGNLKFEASEKDINNNKKQMGTKVLNTNEAKIDSNSAREIRIISNLLQIDEEELKKSLTSRLIASGAKEVVVKYHTTTEAIYSRDALSKALYEQLFSFIFLKINEILDIKNVIKANGYEMTSKKTVIGILDIYGFELFDSNGLILEPL